MKGHFEPLCVKKLSAAVAGQRDTKNSFIGIMISVVSELRNDIAHTKSLFFGFAQQCRRLARSHSFTLCLALHV